MPTPARLMNIMKPIRNTTARRTSKFAAWLEGLSDDLARFLLLPGVIWLFFIDSDAEREIAVQCFSEQLTVFNRFWKG